MKNRFPADDADLSVRKRNHDAFASPAKIRFAVAVHVQGFRFALFIVSPLLLSVQAVFIKKKTD